MFSRLTIAHLFLLKHLSGVDNQKLDLTSRLLLTQLHPTILRALGLAPNACMLAAEVLQRDTALEGNLINSRFKADILSLMPNVALKFLIDLLSQGLAYLT